MKIDRIGAAAVIGLAAVAGCQKEQGATTSAPSTPARTEQSTAAPSGPTTPAAPAQASGAKRTTPSGLTIVEVAPGHGERAAAVGDTVYVHYTGRLQSTGAKFDSSYDRGEPIDFKLGSHQVIAGWEEGIAGMKEGEKRQLVIPPNLGYGIQQMGPIPPNSTLVFDVELARIR